MKEQNTNFDDFFKAGEGIDALTGKETAAPKPVLERLGPAPFRSKGFPLLGFLATLYEHVATSCPQAPTPVPERNREDPD